MRFTACQVLPALLLSPNLSAQPSLTVTLYDAVGLPAEIRQAMKTESSRILLQAGIRVEWAECEVAGQSVNLPVCTLPLGPSRLMLHLMPGRNRNNPRSSGMAIVQKESSAYACIYPERIRDLARDANWGFADLLGHAATHELGHLLLQSGAHSNAGVMRANWEVEDLRRLSHNGLVFLTAQRAVLQARSQTAGN